MGRLILGILAGFITGAVLSIGTDQIFHAAGIFPPIGEPFFETGPLVLATVYRAVYQVIGAYVAAVIAKEKAMTAVWVIGIVGTIFWIWGTVTMSELSPLWYGAVGAVLSIPTTLAGGKLYLARVKKAN